MSEGPFSRDAGHIYFSLPFQYAGNSTVDTSTLSSDIDALVQSVMEFINGSSSWYMPKFLNETLWEETMMSVLAIYMPEGNTTTEAE